VQWFIPVILGTQEAGIERILVQGQYRQKIHKKLPPITINKSWAWWHMSVILDIQGSTKRRITVQASLGINVRSYLKNAYNKKEG
jgi:hypothetical protein